MPCRVPSRSRSSSSSCRGRPRSRWTPSGGGAAISLAAPSLGAGPRTPAGASSKASRTARMSPPPLQVQFSSPLPSFTFVQKHGVCGADLRLSSLDGLPKAELLSITVSRTPVISGIACNQQGGMIADEDVKVEQPQQGQPQGQQQGQQQPATWFSLMQPYLSARTAAGAGAGAGASRRRPPRQWVRSPDCLVPLPLWPAGPRLPGLRAARLRQLRRQADRCAQLSPPPPPSA